jgi:hypothetical protein
MRLQLIIGNMNGPWVVPPLEIQWHNIKGKTATATINQIE